jgi:hypothetical protein
MSKCRGVLLNVRGLHDTDLHWAKAEKVRRLLSEYQADLAVITETHTTKEVNPWEWLQGGVFEHASRKGQFKGVCVVPLNTKCTVSKVVGMKGRFMVVDVTCQGMRHCRLGVIYAPNKDGKRRRFFEECKGWMEKCDILMGDFNCVEGPKDKTGDWTFSQSLRSLSEILVAGEWEDTQGEGAEHTWYGHNGSSRVDRVYWRPNETKLISSETLPTNAGLSDHLPLRFEIVDDEPLGPGKSPLWRASFEVFDSTALCSQLESYVSRFHMKEDEVLWQNWDNLKNKVQSIIKAHLRQTKEDRREGEVAKTLRELTSVSLKASVANRSGGKEETMERKLEEEIKRRRKYA